MSKRKILVVEDENFFSKRLREILENLNYAVSGIAVSSEEAVKMAAETSPDLVLMDIILKGSGDGVEAAGRINKLLDIPIIYLTGLTGDKVIQRAKVTEPYGYILKPFQERELHTVIEIAFYRHEMERKLRDSEGKLNAMLTSIGDHMIMIDIDRNIIWANEVSKNLFGEDITRRKCCEAYHGIKGSHDQEHCLSIKTFKNGKAHRFESETYDKDGNKLCFECTSNVALRNKEGNPLTILEVAKDITSRKSIEAELLKTRSRLEIILKINPAIIYSRRATGDYGATFISDNVSALLGYGPKNFICDSAFWGNHIHPDDRENVFSEITKVFKKSDFCAHEYRFRRKDGSYIWMYDESRLVRDENEKPVEIIGYWTDCTHRKGLEKDVKLRLDEVERLNKLMVGREIKMGELNQENTGLKARIKELEKGKPRKLGARGAV